MPQTIYGLLHTPQGLLVHFDGAVRQGARREAPRNLAVHVSGDEAWLVVFDPADGAALTCVVPAEGGQLGLGGMGQPPHWRLERRGPWIMVACAAGALHLNETGHVSLGARDRATMFCILAFDTLRCLDSLETQSWLRAGGGQDPVQARLRFDMAPVLELDGVVIDPTGLPGPFLVTEAPLRHMVVMGPAGLLVRLILYNPVICLTVFGEEAYYAVLRMALDSLDRFGAYDGTLCIAADRPAEQVAHFVPAAFHGRWRYIFVPAERGLFARYDLADWDLGAFQPILYMDADVVANARLRPLLVSLASGRGVHVTTEDRLFENAAGQTSRALQTHTAGNWFGAWLFAADPRLVDTPLALGSSGIIAADCAGRLAPLCSLVRHLRQAVDPSMVAQFTDQALANYALHALGGTDFQLLDRFVDFARSAETAPTARRGLMHFHSGVGCGEVKRRAMQRYIAVLNDAAVTIA